MTVWRSKKSGPMRLRVCSQAVALAPFSQYSKVAGLAGFDHAQDTHMKPPGLFCFSSMAAPVTGISSRVRMSTSERAEPQPPAGSV